MKKRIQLPAFISDYVFRSFLSSGFSAFCTIAFLVYNLTIGILYRSIWNFSISVYYLILLILRVTILLCEKQWKNQTEAYHKEKQISLFRVITRILLLLDISLAVPISLMVLSKRTVSIGMIPAISIAAYTTYKVVFSIINYIKTREQKNLSLFGLKMINLKDAIVSVLTLQNTMVMVFGDGRSMQTLTAYTSAAILIGMIILTIFLIRKGGKCN